MAARQINEDLAVLSGTFYEESRANCEIRQYDSREELFATLQELERTTCVLLHGIVVLGDVILDSAWLLVRDVTRGIFKEDVNTLDGSRAVLVFAEREEIAWQLVASSPFCCEPDKEEQHGWYSVTAALLLELRGTVPALHHSQRRSASVLESSELPTVLVGVVQAYIWPVAAVPLRWPVMHVLNGRLVNYW